MKKIQGIREFRMPGKLHLVRESDFLEEKEKVFSLNASGAFIWESLGNDDFDREDIRNLLLTKYEISPEMAGSEAGRIMKMWKDAGLIE